MEGWLCPALLKYFPNPPREIYVKVEKLKRYRLALIVNSVFQLPDFERGQEQRFGPGEGSGGGHGGVVSLAGGFAVAWATTFPFSLGFFDPASVWCRDGQVCAAIHNL